jgi:hypothetical protein
MAHAPPLTAAPAIRAVRLTAAPRSVRTEQAGKKKFAVKSSAKCRSNGPEGLTPRPASPRSFDRGPERSKRCGPTCWRPRPQERCVIAAVKGRERQFDNCVIGSLNAMG